VDSAQLQRALDAAAGAQKEWSKTGLEKPYNILMNIGGRGESSYGPREQGQYAKEFYTHVKTAYISSDLLA